MNSTNEDIEFASVTTEPRVFMYVKLQHPAGVQKRATHEFAIPLAVYLCTGACTFGGELINTQPQITTPLQVRG